MYEMLEFDTDEIGEYEEGITEDGEPYTSYPYIGFTLRFNM